MEEDLEKGEGTGTSKARKGRSRSGCVWEAAHGASPELFRFRDFKFMENENHHICHLGLKFRLAFSKQLSN